MKKMLFKLLFAFAVCTIPSLLQDKCEAQIPLTIQPTLVSGSFWENQLLWSPIYLPLNTNETGAILINWIHISSTVAGAQYPYGVLVSSQNSLIIYNGNFNITPNWVSHNAAQIIYSVTEMPITVPGSMLLSSTTIVPYTAQNFPISQQINAIPSTTTIFGASMTPSAGNISNSYTIVQWQPIYLLLNTQYTSDIILNWTYISPYLSGYPLGAFTSSANSITVYEQTWTAVDTSGRNAMVVYYTATMTPCAIPNNQFTPGQ
jgi:hypothetical protein